MSAVDYDAQTAVVSYIVTIAIVLHISNNKKIMKENTNTKLSNVLGFLTLIVITAAAVAPIWFQVY